MFVGFVQLVFRESDNCSFTVVSRGKTENCSEVGHTDVAFLSDTAVGVGCSV